VRKKTSVDKKNVRFSFSPVVSVYSYCVAQNVSIAVYHSYRDMGDEDTTARRGAAPRRGQGNKDVKTPVLVIHNYTDHLSNLEDGQVAAFDDDVDHDDENHDGNKCSKKAPRIGSRFLKSSTRCLPRWMRTGVKILFPGNLMDAAFSYIARKILLIM
jgi:hypothetical protein